MISSIIDFSLKNRFLIIMGSLLLLAAGIFSAMHLPVDAVPDITNTQVQINTAVPGLAPKETEKLVTYPLELAHAGIQGVEEFRSLTKSGLSQVTLVFRDGSDLFRARQLVSERLVQVELPTGLSPKMSPISTFLTLFLLPVLYRWLVCKPTRTHVPQEEPALLAHVAI